MFRNISVVMEETGKATNDHYDHSGNTSSVGKVYFPGMLEDEELTATNVFRMIVDKAVVPTICVIGIVGNLLCIIVFTRNRLRRSVESQEKVVHVGLLSLSLSDLFFCTAQLPRVFIPEKTIVFRSGSFVRFYQVYSTGFLTTFGFVSTWLIVTTAGIRYMGICHPLRARYLVSAKGIYIAIGIIIAISILCNLPSFWLFTTVKFEQQQQQNGTHNRTVSWGEDSLEHIDLGSFSHHFTRGVALMWSRNILGVFLPGILLVYFNVRLILALKASSALQRQHVPDRVDEGSRRRQSRHDTCRNRLTRTLVAVVAVFIICVYPSELMDFVIQLNPSAIHDRQGFIVARVIANVFQVCNFASNFLLYCILSETFRGTLKEVFKASACRKSCCGGVHGLHNDTTREMNSTSSRHAYGSKKALKTTLSNSGTNDTYV